MKQNASRRLFVLAAALSCVAVLRSVSPALAAPVDDMANCGKRIAEGLQKYTQNYSTGLGNCYLGNGSLTFPLDCRVDQRTKGIITSAREKLQTSTQKCGGDGLDLLCPIEQRLPADLYDVLALDTGSYESRVDALLDAIFRTSYPGCPSLRPAGFLSRAGIDCGRTLSGQVPKGIAQVQQCIAKCEVAVTRTGGEPCVDFATGEVRDAKTLDCIARASERMYSVLNSRCTDATVVELGCPFGTSTESAMVAALQSELVGFTTGIERDVFHAGCRTYIPVGLIPTTATATLMPSGTPVEIHCGQTLDAAFFGADTQLLLTQDLDCSDAGATDGLVIATSSVNLDIGDSFRITGPRRASERTGAGIRLAAGVSEVVVNHGLVQKFGIGVTDTDAATNVGNTLSELSVRDHAIAGVVMAGQRARLDTLSVKNNAGDGIVLNSSDGVLTASTAEDNVGSGAVVNGDDNEVESNALGNLRDRGNGGYGLRVTGAGNHIYSNYAAVNSLDGFAIEAATSGIFDSNVSVSNGGVGIRLSTAGSQVESNRSEKNAGYEYEIAAGNADLGNNRANGSVFAFPPAGGSYE